MNIFKTKIFWPSYDGSKLHGELFPSDIERPIFGMKFHGGNISLDEVFIEGLFIKRAVEVVELMHFLPQQMDTKSELLLLLSCLGITKLFFGLRMCQTNHF